MTPWKVLKILFILFLIGFFYVAENAHARSEYIPGSRYTSARAAGMGEAFMPFALDGASALFYQPANIAGLQKPAFELFNFQLLANTNVLSAGGITFYRAASLSAFNSNLATIPEKFAAFGYTFLPVYSMRGFAFGLMYQATHMARITNGVVHSHSLYQLIPTAGFGIPLARGIVKLGYSLQWVHKATGDVSPATGYSDGLLKGSAFSHNVGFSLNLPYKLLPSVNVVARNVLGATYGSTAIVPFTGASSGTPPEEPMSIDASFSIQPKTGNGGNLNFSVGLRDSLGSSGASLMKRLNAGLEFMFRNSIALRAGYRSQYLSLGFGVTSQSGEFNAALYSEDIGNENLSVKDTRFLIQYQVRIQ